MEIHLLYIVWCTALVFTVLSYFAKNNHAFPLIAGIAWILTAMSFGEVTYIGFTSMGTPVSDTIQAGDPNTAGQVAAIWFFGGLGLVMIILTGGWVLTGTRVGSDV